MENWLRKNKDVLSITAVGKRIGCGPSTLDKVVNGRKLPKKWIEPLKKFKESMCECNNLFERPIDQNISDYPKDIIGNPDDIIQIPEMQELSSDAIKKMVDENKDKKTRRF